MNLSTIVKLKEVNKEFRSRYEKIEISIIKSEKLTEPYLIPYDPDLSKRQIIKDKRAIQKKLSPFIEFNEGSKDYKKIKNNLSTEITKKPFIELPYVLPAVNTLLSFNRYSIVPEITSNIIHRLPISTIPHLTFIHFCDLKLPKDIDSILKRPVIDFRIHQEDGIIKAEEIREGDSLSNTLEETAVNIFQQYLPVENDMIRCLHQYWKSTEYNVNIKGSLDRIGTRPTVKVFKDNLFTPDLKARASVVAKIINQLDIRIF